MKILTFFLCISHALAMEGSYGEGKKSALALLEKDKNTATTFAAKEVPGFTTANPPEASLDENNINGAVAKAIPGNPAAQFIKQSSQTRPAFKMDAEKDPLFVESGKVADNPESVLKLQTHKQGSQIKKTRYTCLKGQDLFEKKCLWMKVPVKVGMRKEYTSYTYNLGWRSLWNDYLQHLGDNTYQFLVWLRGPLSKHHPGAYVPGQKSAVMDKQISVFCRVYNGRDAFSGAAVKIDTKKIVWLELLQKHGPQDLFQGDTKNFGQGWLETVQNSGPYDSFSSAQINNYSQFSVGSPKYLKYKVTIGTDVPVYKLEDKNTCEALEAMADRGQCGYKSKRCLKGAETRIIEGVPVYAACWEEEAVYQCQGDFVDNCKHYLEKGCYQLSSKCTIPIGKTCVQWEQTFECVEKPGQSTSYRLTGSDKAFCMDGDCVDSAYVANNEMLQALSQMSILRQAEKDLKGSLSIFKGNDKRCSRSCIAFKDCCGNGNGWGVSLGLSQCGQDEVQLARERQEGKCVRIGTYCANRKLGICIKKNTSFCCFSSRLSRLLQENGRKQLNLSFGSAENPECRGFTPQELSQLDFSQMDLSELFEDIQKNFKPQSAESITGSINLKNLEMNMKNLASGKK